MQGYNLDNLVLSTELMMWTEHHKEIWKLTFGALALRQNELLHWINSAQKRQLSNPFTVANSHYQPSW